MKKLSLFLMGCLLTSSGLAQPCIQSAWQYFTQKNIPKARVALEQCPQTNQILNNPQYWLLKGNIYLRIAENEKESASPKFPDAPLIAYEAFNKALELNDNKDVTMTSLLNALQGQGFCGNFLYNQGLKYFKDTVYATAIKYMEYAVKCFESTAVKQNFNVANHLLAICAKENKDMDLYKKTLERSVALKTDIIDMYLRLIDLYKSDNDTVKALKIMNDTKKRFPEEVLILKELSLLAWADKKEEFNATMDEALVIYEDSTKIMTSLVDVLILNKNLEKVEPVILKLLEKSPEDFEVNAAAGACYYLMAEEIGKEKSKAASEFRTKDAQRLTAQLNELNQKALIYLEKAYQKNPDDMPNFIRYYQTLFQLMKPISKDLEEKFNSFRKK